MASRKRRRIPDYGRPRRREIGFWRYFRNLFKQAKKENDNIA
ncbi:MAG: hypothetical protein AAGG00_13150 [Cyanobacteria bacterium P01_H01_bin.150]